MKLEGRLKRQFLGKAGMGARTRPPAGSPVRSLTVDGFAGTGRGSVAALNQPNYQASA